MPYKRKNGTTAVARRSASTGAVKRRKTTRAAYPRYRGLGVPFPQTMKCEMVYCNILQMTANPWGTRNCSANGLYSPDTIGGHQPFYFDTLISVYDKYHVTASKIKVELAQIPSRDVGFAVWLDDDITASTTSFSLAMERAATTGGMWEVGNPTYAKALPMLYASWTQKNFNASGSNNSTLTGGSTSNPFEEQRYTFYLEDLSGGGLFTCNIAYEIRYQVTWSELRNMAQS